MNTNYPIIELDNSKHSRPEKFWQLAFLAMEQLPEEIDTVLLGLGVCGGASVGWTFPRRTIMPKVDDCITLFNAYGRKVSLQPKRSRTFLFD